MHAKVGSAPVMERVDVDQEDWDTILAWTGRAYDVAQTLLQKKAADSPRDIVQGALSDAVRATDYLYNSLEEYANSQNEASARFSRANPYTAALAARSSLCVPCRDIVEPKSVIRVEIAVDPEKISYTAGDSLGILPQNNAESVARLLQVLASNGDEIVSIDGVSDPLPLEEALMDRLDLRVIRAELIVALAEISTAKLEKGAGSASPCVRTGKRLCHGCHCGAVNGGTGIRRGAACDRCADRFPQRADPGAHRGAIPAAAACAVLLDIVISKEERQRHCSDVGCGAISDARGGSRRRSEHVSA